MHTHLSHLTNAELIKRAEYWIGIQSGAQVMLYALDLVTELTERLKETADNKLRQPGVYDD